MQLLKHHTRAEGVTFAQCRFGAAYQKYTTLWYTNEASPVLDLLSIGVRGGVVGRQNEG